MSSSSLLHYLAFPSHFYGRDPTIADETPAIRRRRLYTVIWTATLFIGFSCILSIFLSFWKHLLLALIWAVAWIPGVCMLDQFCKRTWGKEWFCLLDEKIVNWCPFTRGGTGNPPKTRQDARKIVYLLVGALFYTALFFMAFGCYLGLKDSIELTDTRKLIAQNMNETRHIEMLHQKKLAELQKAVDSLNMTAINDYSLDLNASYLECVEKSWFKAGWGCQVPLVNESLALPWAEHDDIEKAVRAQLFETRRVLYNQDQLLLSNLSTLQEAQASFNKTRDELLKRTWWDNYGPLGAWRRMNAHAKINRDRVSQPLAILFGICVISAGFITARTWSYAKPTDFQSDWDLLFWIVATFLLAASYAGMVFMKMSGEFTVAGNEIANQMLSPAWQAFIELGQSPFLLTCHMFTHDPYGIAVIGFSAIVQLVTDLRRERKVNKSALLTTLLAVVAFDVAGRSVLATTLSYEPEQSLTDAVLKGVDFFVPGVSSLWNLMRSRRKLGATA